MMLHVIAYAAVSDVCYIGFEPLLLMVAGFQESGHQ